MAAPGREEGKEEKEETEETLTAHALALGPDGSRSPRRSRAQYGRRTRSSRR